MDQHLDPAPQPHPQAIGNPDAGLDGAFDLDRALLGDAAAVLSARQQLECLLAELTVRPFSPTAYRDLRAFLSGPADRAQAAYQRICASTTGRDA